ncbi:BMC_2a_G0057380.mRNA.1.CDS.1 [Saccharomyces cerevisiae]|nr:BMC_2a_G0057380.mRNA.1.CDS.1 [Saccharomyces cerevisiae]CAI4803285.1 BMB_G0057350.mRNA.1.CDS.1 [Saccharomyces cerevisiae]CAI7355817.1 BMC_2a_G0057380.mRNA.1.CDS.1 [Saccharomyces cerevisiae]CAI7358685.1 BMB_G0057350.mRNA.1.CDS.1 [Saccharomyces cerevisiae]
MKLANVLGAVAFTSLMDWEASHEEYGIQYLQSTDGNENGLTAIALATNGSYIDDITVYGDNPILPWLQEFAAELDDFAQQLYSQGISQDQYNEGNLTCSSGLISDETINGSTLDKRGGKANNCGYFCGGNSCSGGECTRCKKHSRSWHCR